MEIHVSAHTHYITIFFYKIIIAQSASWSLWQTTGAATIYDDTTGRPIGMTLAARHDWSTNGRGATRQTDLTYPRALKSKAHKLWWHP